MRNFLPRKIAKARIQQILRGGTFSYASVATVLGHRSGTTWRCNILQHTTFSPRSVVITAVSVGAKVFTVRQFTCRVHRYIKSSKLCSTFCTYYTFSTYVDIDLGPC